MKDKRVTLDTNILIYSIDKDEEIDSIIGEIGSEVNQDQYYL